MVAFSFKPSAALRMCLCLATLGQTAALLACENNASNGTVYSPPNNGDDFLVLCGVDHGGGDLTMAQANSFAACIDLCADSPSCLAVSYVHGACYLKDRLNPLSPAGHVWTGRRVVPSAPSPSPTNTPPSTEPPTCEDGASHGTSYLTETGSTYDIICGQEYHGGDLQLVHVPSFQGCIAACDSIPGCVDVSYVGGACYTKSSTSGALVAAAHVWTARKTANGTAQPARLSCEQGQSDGAQYTTQQGVVFGVFCGQDFSGDDIAGGATFAVSFEECLEFCQSLRGEGCEAVAYTGGTFSGGQCYAKTSVGDPTARSWVWGARILGDAPSSTVTSSPTPSATVSSSQDSSSSLPSSSESSTASGSSSTSPEPSSDAGGSSSTPPASDSSSTSDPSSTTDSSSTSDTPSTTTDSSSTSVFPSEDASTPTTSSSSTETSTELDSTSSSTTLSTTTLSSTSDRDTPSSSTTTTSYSIVTLPVTFPSTSTRYVPNPTGTPLCLADPAATPDAQFHLVDRALPGFLVSRGDRPGTPPRIETQEEGEAVLAAIHDWVPALYTFESPADAPTGLYDIVLADETGRHYLTIDGDGGQVVFAAASSLATTVFSAGCDGRVLARRNGTTYTLRVTDDGFVKAVPGVLGNGVTVLPPQHRATATTSQPSTPWASNRRRQAGERVMPRCPGAPGNGYPFPRPGVGPVQPNGCGSRDSEWVPELNWNHCCNNHDMCFGDCYRGFTECNFDFLGCMLQQCRDDAPWWNPYSYAACSSVAVVYYLGVSTPMAVDAFYRATEERCECRCNWTNLPLCPRSPDPFRPDLSPLECTNIEHDNDHCGGCGQKCPPTTHCRDGQCVCDWFQGHMDCGVGYCVPILNNPLNCGSCGFVCDGLCIEGWCYD